ncbi:MAG TPA: VOC family protein [Thermoplasmata archaeon]|nr:VOC family protein [Thermoplasmata archaeon]
MKIKLVSIFVDDQEKALRFYTEKLAFVKRHDVPVGKHRWITVVSREEPNGAELVLEPNENPISQDYQAALKGQGIPATMFFVSDLEREVARLKGLGVEFKLDPMKVTGSTIAQLNDTCGNIIQIAQLDREE